MDTQPVIDQLNASLDRLITLVRAARLPKLINYEGLGDHLYEIATSVQSARDLLVGEKDRIQAEVAAAAQKVAEEAAAALPKKAAAKKPRTATRAI